MRKRWPLTVVLGALGVAQLTFVALSVGAVAYFTGRQSTLDLAEEFSASITDRVMMHLDQLVKAPVLINRLNQASIQGKRIQLADKRQLEQLFWEQMQLFPVGYVNYGGEDGTYVGLERLDDGGFNLNLMGGEFGRRVQVVHAVGLGGKRGVELDRYEDIGEAKHEAWYVETVKAAKPVWSSIYQWDDKPEVLSISHNVPIYGPQRQLLGVIGVDLILTQLSSFLAQIWGQQPGMVMILEPNGQLVASSSRGGALKRNAQGEWQRLNVNQAYPQLGMLLAASLKELPHSKAATANRLIALDGATSDPYFLNLHRWSDPEGLNWIIAVLIPQSRFVGPFQQAFAVAVVASLLVLLISIVLNIRALRWLLRPLRLLTDASRRLNQTLLSEPSGVVSLRCELPASSPREFEALHDSLAALVFSFNALMVRWRQSSEHLLNELEQQDLPGSLVTHPSGASVAPSSAPAMLSALLQQLKHSWDEQRGPTAPPLQLLFAPEVGELVIAEAANLIALLQEQLVSAVADQPDRQQLQLKTAIQRSSGATELVFTLIGPPDLDLLRMALPG